MAITFLTDSFAVSPQISVDDLVELKAQGFVGVVCNRPDYEEAGQPTAAEIEAACMAQGLTFAHIPMNGPNFSQSDVNALKEIMTLGKTFAYCRSGNRSSILWKAAQA